MLSLKSALVLAVMCMCVCMSVGAASVYSSQQQQQQQGLRGSHSSAVEGHVEEPVQEGAAVVPDKHPPVIQQLVYPAESPAGADFTALLTVTDASGVSGGYMVVRETAGYNYVGCTASDMYLDSGTATNGVWRASCFIPRDAPNGAYWLEIHVNDVAQNQAGLNEKPAFTLTGGSKPDLIPPSINNMKFSDDHVEWGQTFQFTAHITDADTGVNHVDFWAVNQFVSYDQFCKGSMTLMSGDSKDGVWGYWCTVPVGSEYTVYSASVLAYDNQNNQGYATVSFHVVPSTAK